MKKINEYGRSMIEILAVLAIIGVLTIGSISGYRMAMILYRANSMMNELDQRAILVSAMFMNGQAFSDGTVIDTDLGNKLQTGEIVTEFQPDGTQELFGIDVEDVSVDVCKKIVEDYPTAAWILINGEFPSTCSEENNQLTFYYTKDLSGERRHCSAKGVFNEATLKCECRGETYYDSTVNDCKCPGAHIWNDARETCIESICKEGQFESQEEGCVSCSTDKAYFIANNDRAYQLCEACQDDKGNAIREAGWTWGVCYKKACKEGYQFIREANGGCELCTSTETYIGKTAYAQHLCNECGEGNKKTRYYADRHCYKTDDACVAKKDTSGTKYFPARDFKCYSCNTLSEPIVGDEGQANQACKNCGNRSVVYKDREYKCVKTTCATGEFKGSDGQCYGCSTTHGIAVGDNSGCTDTSCGRVKEDGYCKLKDCPAENVRTSNGGCYSCDQAGLFEATEEECHKCAGRYLVYDDWTNKYTCSKVKCADDEYPSKGTSCKPCNQEGYGATTADEIAFCEACGNYANNGYCVPNTCTAGTHFPARRSGGGSECALCTNTLKSNIGSAQEAAQLCVDCKTAKRFATRSYCHRCDTDESPVVKTDFEMDACIDCGIRELVEMTNDKGVKETRCVLKIAEPEAK